MHSKVKVGRFAHGAVLGWAAASADGKETGGWLLGQELALSSSPVVLDATGPGAAAKRGVGTLTPDIDQEDLASIRHRRFWSEMGYGEAHGSIGFWHTHPRTAREGGDRPSDEDIETFDVWTKHLGVERYVALILTPDEWRGWDRPEIHGWMFLRDNGRGRSGCERVELDLADACPETRMRAERAALAAPASIEQSPLCALSGATRPSWKLPRTPTRRPRGHGKPARTQDTGASSPRRKAAIGDDRMMVAVHSFEARYDGQLEQIIAGASYARASHPLVRRHLENWAPAPAVRAAKTGSDGKRATLRPRVDDIVRPMGMAA